MSLLEEQNMAAGEANKCQCLDENIRSTICQIKELYLLVKYQNYLIFL